MNYGTLYYKGKYGLMKLLEFIRLKHWDKDEYMEANIGQIKTLIITVLIFLWIFLIRVPYINNSPCEQGDYWRQSDTEAIARNFLEDKFNIFYPQFNYDGPKPNYIQLEFQITTFLIAFLYKFFGYHYFLARIVPMGFFMGSAIYLYSIAKKYYDYRTAWFTVIVYSIMPTNLFYSRAIMPESAALFFFIGGFYYFILWYESDNLHTLLLSALFTCLAISQKTPTVFMGLAMLFMALKKHKLKAFEKWELWAFAALSLIPNIIYIKWSKSISEFDFVNNIAALHILPKSLKSIISLESLIFAGKEIALVLSPAIAALSIIGIIDSKWDKEHPLIIWTLVMILEAIAVAAVIKLRYYFIFITPLAALWVGRALGGMGKKQKTRIGIFISLIFLTFFNYYAVKGFFIEKEDILKQVEIIERYAQKEDLIIIGVLEPTLLNQSRRSGWRANVKYYKDRPYGPKEEISNYIEKGARYFSPLGGFINRDDGSYKNYLEDNFEKVGDEKYYIYKLK